LLNNEIKLKYSNKIGFNKNDIKSIYNKRRKGVGIG
jgi:hypothetical protein